jgi:CDP-glucose 4,6-dehydratase
MKVLLTGHTGFKGSWLTLMLKQKGHNVYGISLDPNVDSLFKEAEISKYLSRDSRIDIRNRDLLSAEIESVNPDVIIHLAAQSLVRESYLNPVSTFETNIIGTLNVLESTRRISNLRATLIITTDKVYKNKGQVQGYLTSDELGGSDPYSVSKAAADLLTQSWRSSFGTTPISIARAGNVIGGGDWAKERLVPDTMRAILGRSELFLRYPESIRPWQHVLDCLNGYLELLESQIERGTQGEWNFGPKESDVLNVSELVKRFCSQLGTELTIKTGEKTHHEEALLLLDSNLTRQELNWTEKLDLQSAIEWTADWYRHLDKVKITLLQVESFLAK